MVDYSIFLFKIQHRKYNYPKYLVVMGLYGVSAMIMATVNQNIPCKSERTSLERFFYYYYFVFVCFALLCFVLFVLFCFIL